MNIDDMGTWEMTESFWDIYEDYPMYEELELCEFLECCASGSITDDDGIADVVYDSGEIETSPPSHIVALPPDTKRMIKVIHWFNK